MQDKNVSIRAVIATTLWVLGTALVLVDMATESYEVGNLGLVMVGGAMTLQVRGYFVRMHRQMRQVFDVGRDYERGYNPDLRSVR